MDCFIWWVRWWWALNYLFLREIPENYVLNFGTRGSIALMHREI